MDLKNGVNILQNICEMLLGLGTFLIGIMGYRLTRREYVPLIKASFDNIFFKKSNSDIIDQHAFAINAYNSGKREILITGVKFKYKRYPFTEYIHGHDLCVFISEYDFSTPLPFLLKDGQTLSLVYPPDTFHTYKFKNELIQHRYFLLTVFRILFLKIYLCTSIKYEIKVKFSLKIKKQIILDLRKLSIQA